MTFGLSDDVVVEVLVEEVLGIAPTAETINVRKGLTMSADRADRIWKKAGLQVPRRRPRRRVATGRPRPLPATGANQVWAYDFVFDRSANGQQLKCLTVIDEFTRECLAIDAAVSLPSGYVIDRLSKLISVRAHCSTCDPTTDRTSCLQQFCNRSKC